MSELLKEIDEALKLYECKYHTWPSFETPHGCTDCYNTGYILDNPEVQLLVKVYDHIHSITAENEKLKRIVEVYEKSNNLYAEYGNDNPDSIYNFETARQAKEEVERIRGEGK